MDSGEKQISWNLTIRAALIMTAIGLALFGVISMDRVDCRVCWKDLTHHYLSVFGYFAMFGYAIGWTLPSGPSETVAGKHSWTTRQGFWEGSLGVGAMLATLFAALHLLA